MKPLDVRGEHTAEEWEAHKEVFIQLYLTEDKHLKEVREIMKDEYGFYATEKQYKTRIAKWNLDKNIRDSDMKVMLRKGLKRKLEDGKDSHFEVNGRPVQDHKMERFARRKKLGQDEILKDEILTPPYIDCYTPLPSSESQQVNLPNVTNPCAEEPIPECIEYVMTISTPRPSLDDERCRNYCENCSFSAEISGDATIEDFDLMGKLYRLRKQDLARFPDRLDIETLIVNQFIFPMDTSLQYAAMAEADWLVDLTWKLFKTGQNLTFTLRRHFSSDSNFHMFGCPSLVDSDARLSAREAACNLETFRTSIIMTNELCGISGGWSFDWIWMMNNTTRDIVLKLERETFAEILGQLMLEYENGDIWYCMNLEENCCKLQKPYKQRV